MCDAWRESFEAFLADVGPRPSSAHSLERVNNDGHYEPCNCRWATHIEQQRNKRSTRWLTFKGERLPLSAWAKRIGMRRNTLDRRIRSGGSVEDALTTPPIHKGRWAHF